MPIAYLFKKRTSPDYLSWYSKSSVDSVAADKFTDEEVGKQMKFPVIPVKHPFSIHDIDDEPLGNE